MSPAKRYDPQTASGTLQRREALDTAAQLLYPVVVAYLLIPRHLGYTNFVLLFPRHAS